MSLKKSETWEEEFGDHEVCPECGTQCHQLFLDSSLQSVESEAFALPEISTTTLKAVIYSPRYDAVHKQLAKALLEWVTGQ